MQIRNISTRKNMSSHNIAAQSISHHTFLATKYIWLQNEKDEKIKHKYKNTKTQGKTLEPKTHPRSEDAFSRRRWE